MAEQEIYVGQRVLWKTAPNMVWRIRYWYVDKIYTDRARVELRGGRPIYRWVKNENLEDRS